MNTEDMIPSREDLAARVHHVLMECDRDKTCFELSLEDLARLTNCLDRAILSNAVGELQEAGLVDVDPRKLYLQE